MTHVTVNKYPVQKVTFNETEIDYWVAEVSLAGLDTGKKECPYGLIGFGETENEARDDVREQLKELSYSKKEIEYKRAF